MCERVRAQPDSGVTPGWRSPLRRSTSLRVRAGPRRCVRGALAFACRAPRPACGPPETGSRPACGPPESGPLAEDGVTALCAGATCAHQNVARCAGRGGAGSHAGRGTLARLRTRLRLGARGSSAGLASGARVGHSRLASVADRSRAVRRVGGARGITVWGATSPRACPHPDRT